MLLGETADDAGDADDAISYVRTLCDSAKLKGMCDGGQFAL